MTYMVDKLCPTRSNNYAKHCHKIMSILHLHHGFVTRVWRMRTKNEVTGLGDLTSS